MEEEKDVQEQNQFEQLATERTGVVEHQEIIRFTEVHRNFLMSLSDHFDIGIRYSAFDAFVQRLLESLIQLLVLMSKDACEHEAHGVQEDPSRMEVDAEEKIQNARNQHVGNIDICRDGNQRDIEIAASEEY